MKRLYAARRWFCAVACVGIVFPLSPVAAQQPDRPIAPADNPAPADAPAPMILDVQLKTGGVLAGQVVDASGSPLRGAAVAIWYGSQQVAHVDSDANGRFAVSGLQGGMHRIDVADGRQGVQVCRLWAVDTAPPDAQAGVLMVTPGTVARGDFAPSLTPAPLAWVTTPWVMAGAVALAIAVPVAVFNHRENLQSSS